MSLDYGFLNSFESGLYFIEKAYDLTPKELNKELAYIWSLVEFPRYVAPYEEWEELFSIAGLVVDEETSFKAFDELDDEITIYRSAPEEFKHGMSWTTDLEVAKWFNARNHVLGYTDAKIYTGKIYKGSILGIFNDRKESEVVISEFEFEPNQIKVIK